MYLIIAPKDIEIGNIYQILLESGYKYFCICSDRIYIVQQAGTGTSSLINNYLVADTLIYVFSPFDPLFLVVSGLFERPDSFCEVQDIMNSSKFGGINDIKPSMFDLDTICDLKIFEENLYARINLDKLKNWLRAKYEGVSQEVSARVSWARSEVDQGTNGRKVALGILLEFLDKRLVLDLDSRYTLELIYNAGKVLNKRPPIQELNPQNKKKITEKKENNTIKPKQTSKQDKNQISIHKFMTKK
jgi:hypothetical protein